MSTCPRCGTQFPRFSLRRLMHDGPLAAFDNTCYAVNTAKRIALLRQSSQHHTAIANSYKLLVRSWDAYLKTPKPPSSSP